MHHNSEWVAVLHFFRTSARSLRFHQNPSQNIGSSESPGGMNLSNIATLTNIFSKNTVMSLTGDHVNSLAGTKKNIRGLRRSVLMSIAGSPKNAVEKALPAMPSCQKACQTFSRQAFRNRHREMELAEPALKQYPEALAGMFTESGDPRERKRASLVYHHHECDS